MVRKTGGLHYYGLYPLRLFCDLCIIPLEALVLSERDGIIIIIVESFARVESRRRSLCIHSLSRIASMLVLKADLSNAQLVRSMSIQPTHRANA